MKNFSFIKKNIPIIAVPAFFAIHFTSCSTVKPYQRVYLNDQAMNMGKNTLEKFNQNVHTYREGASGGGRGRTSGGCGCN